jgi:hypothetical protein
MAVTMYNAVREFMSRRYPKKGKKGIGNKNRSHNPPIKRMNFHLSLSLVYNILMISFYIDLLRDIELLKKKNYVLVTVRVYFNYGLWYSLL